MQLPLWIIFHHSELLLLIFFLQQKCLLLVFHFDNDMTFWNIDVILFLQQINPFYAVSPMKYANIHSEIDLITVLKLFSATEISFLGSVPHGSCKHSFWNRSETFSATEIIHSLQYPPWITSMQTFVQNRFDSFDLFVVAPLELFPDPAPE